ncbi:MAG: hypothetical protein K2M79_03230 [Muribaculaceae bacterium]|nr:hypothetical protein [Muribaculaceae bacterium]
MGKSFEIESLHCLCSSRVIKDKAAYILYPMDMLLGWVDAAAERYGTTIIVITGMDWQNVFSPWPAKGVPKGSPDFKGESARFMELFNGRVIPQTESVLGLEKDVTRTLVGVSMSGLYALWQWMQSRMFTNIACLSGSFWYTGFMEWMSKLKIPRKDGKGYFLLGTEEAKSRVRAFDSVEKNTREIVTLLENAGIDVTFESVPGNHYSDPIPRLDRAFAALSETD